MKWIENNKGMIVLFIGIILIIEMGIGAWRLPKEFRSSIVPKLNNQINNYDDTVSDVRTIVEAIKEIEMRLNMIIDLEEQDFFSSMGSNQML